MPRTSTSTAVALEPASRLATLPAGEPEYTLGYEAADWVCNNLLQPNGPRAGLPFRLTLGQFRFLLWWYAVDRKTGDWLFNHGARRLAKGPIAHDTAVMTPGGWKQHGDLRVGDEVYAADGSITAVVEVKPEVTEPGYLVTFRDGSQVTCTGSHRWPMDQFIGRGKRLPVIVTAEEMYSAGLVYDRPLTNGKTKATRGGVSRWCSSPTPPIEGRQAEFPIPPYLLGYWLGAGDSDCPRVTLHMSDYPNFAAQCKRLDVECGEPRSKKGETARVRFGRGWAQAALRDAELFYNKRIPPRLLRASLDQRWELLRGIVDSDGSIDKTGQVEVCVMVGPLADDIFELAVSLGLMPTRKDAAAALNGVRTGTRARIRFAPQPGEIVSLLPRKAERINREHQHSRPFSRCRTVTSIEPIGDIPARCIRVDHPSHQYLVGDRNIPTCNSGKSPFAAVLALIEFCAPVRLSRFDESRSGKCRGRPVDMPLVQIAATAESQTANTMRMVRAFAPKGSAVAKAYKMDVGKTRYYRLPEGTLEVITSSATAAEGAEASFIVADETENWKPANGGVELAAVLEDNLAKSGNRMLETSNAWVPGANSVAEATWTAWLLQEEGRTRGERRILYDARIAPPDTDMSDPDSLRGALEWTYGDCDWKRPHKRVGRDVLPIKDEPPDVRPIMERIWSPKARPDDSKRKYLNWPTAADDAWIEPEQWNRLAAPTITVDPDDPVVLFFDGSKSRDATALIGCTVDTGHVFTLGVWEPNPHIPDETVDAADVDRVVMQAFDDLSVVAFFADVREWEQFALTEWPRRYKDNLKIWAAPQARPPQPIAWDMRGHAYEFAKATEACYAEIVDGAFTHDGNSAVARHVANARRRPYRDAIAIAKESPHSPRKIDAAVCVIGARMVRRIVLGSGKHLGPAKRARVIVLR